MGSAVSEDFIRKLFVAYKQEVKVRESKVEALIKPMATILTNPQLLYLGVEKSHQHGLGLKKKIKLSGNEMPARLSYPKKGLSDQRKVQVDFEVDGLGQTIVDSRMQNWQDTKTLLR